MRRLNTALLVLAALVCPIGQAIGQPLLSVCDYEPPESRLTGLSLQGSFQWYDGPYADDRTRTVSMTVGADYGDLFSSAAFGHRLDAHGELRGTADEWSFALRGDGDLKAFWADDVFGLGAFGVDGSNEALEVDLTVGLGTGRFRDVTPMAKAIRIQNELLDLGVLLAPLENEPLLALAQILGDASPTDEEKTVALAEHLISTGLVSDNDLGVRGLLAIEETIGFAEGGRLCGGDVQARIGLAAIVVPEPSLATTGILLYNYALVPDPVSQFTSNASLKARLAHLDELSGEFNLSYSRRLPEGWTARAAYRLTYDHGWSQPDQTQTSHVLSASLITQLFGSVGLSLAGELRYKTADEEITSSLTVHLAYDLF
jgi:hypothetical protein